MYEQIEKPKENKSRAVANSVAQKKNNVKQGFGFVDNRPEVSLERNLKVIANSNFQVMQCKRYDNGDVEPPSGKNVRYSEVEIQGLKATKRMQAENLSYKTKHGGSVTSSGNHSPLFLALRKYFNFGELHDLHMLHKDLGGEGKPPNLVPGTKETNNNMMDFEQAVIAKIDNNQYTFAVVDYEVTANYGRTGNYVKAALPTSIDMRVTEKQYDETGNNWIDDNVVHVRNVAVRAPSDFGAPDALLKLDNEENLNDSNPITTNQNVNRTLNSQFGDNNWARNEIFRVDDPVRVLHHWKNHNLISINADDPHFKFSQQQLEEGLNLTFKEDRDKLRLQFSQNEELFIRRWSNVISSSAARSVGVFGYPRAAIDSFREGLEKLMQEGLLEEMMKYLSNIFGISDNFESRYMASLFLRQEKNNPNIAAHELWKFYRGKQLREMCYQMMQEKGINIDDKAGTEIAGICYYHNKQAVNPFPIVESIIEKYRLVLLAKREVYNRYKRDKIPEDSQLEDFLKLEYDNYSTKTENDQELVNYLYISSETKFALQPI